MPSALRRRRYIAKPRVAVRRAPGKSSINIPVYPDGVASVLAGRGADVTICIDANCGPRPDETPSEFYGLRARSIPGYAAYREPRALRWNAFGVKANASTSTVTHRTMLSDGDLAKTEHLLETLRTGDAMNPTFVV